MWDSNVTRGSNLAVAQANQVIAALGGAEATPPTIFLPQRESYNPGGFEWSATRQPSDFEVWTYAYDVSGLSSVTLKYRVDADGANPLGSAQNETFVGGGEVGAWTTIPMSSSDVAPPAGIASPTYRAPAARRNDRRAQQCAGRLLRRGHRRSRQCRPQRHSARLHRLHGDAPGSIDRRDGAQSRPGGPARDGHVQPGRRPARRRPQVYLHYGFDGWQNVPADQPMAWNAGASQWSIGLGVPTTASQLDAVFNNGAGVWDNNGGQDWHFPVVGATAPTFTLDGQLDAARHARRVQRRPPYLRGGRRQHPLRGDRGCGRRVATYSCTSPTSPAPCEMPTGTKRGKSPTGTPFSRTRTTTTSKAGSTRQALPRPPPAPTAA